MSTSNPIGNSLTTVSRVDSRKDFESLRIEWDDLLARINNDNIFLTHTWLFTWWEVFGGSRQLYILVARSGGALTGVAPMMLTESKKWGVTRRIIEFIGAPNADYADFLGFDRESLLDKFVEYLITHKKEWDSILLTQIPETSPTINILGCMLNQHRIYYRSRVIEYCSRYIYEGEEIDRAKFTIRRNSTLRKTYNFLSRAGLLAIENVDTTDDINRRLPGFYHSHLKRWKNTSTPSKFRFDQNRLFYKKLVETMAPLGQISFLVLKLDNLPLAYLFAYDYSKVIYLYTVVPTTFYERKSTGIFLLILATEKCIRQGSVRIDFARGKSPYKELFTNIESKNYQIEINRSRVQHFLGGLYLHFKEIGLVHQLLQNPGIQGFKTRLVGLVNDHGAAGALMRLAGGIARRIVDYRSVVVLMRSHVARVAVNRLVEIEIQQLTTSDIPQIASFCGIIMGSTEHEELISRFNRNAKCFAAISKDTIASLIWVYSDHIDLPEIGNRFSMGTEGTGLSEPETSLLYLNAGIEEYLIWYVTDRMESDGHKVITICPAYNKDRLRKLSVLGFERRRSIHCLKVMGLKIL